MNENCIICEEKLTFEELNNNFLNVFMDFVMIVIIIILKKK